MKEKRIEIMNYMTIYVAADGTEFENKEQCEMYDRSALGVVKARVKNAAVKITDEWEAVGGDPDHECWIVVPKTAEDVANIRQLLALYGNGNPSDEIEKQIGKPVFLMWNYDKNYVWFKTLESIVKCASGE